MCIVIYALDAHPKYRLILATNRDEFLHRSTSPATWRRSSDLLPVSKGETGDVLSGRDEVGGGLWFGMNKRGELGVLTNFTEPPPPTPPSSAHTRGALVPNFLTSPSPSDPETYLADLASHSRNYTGFNLLLLSLFPTRPTAAGPEAWYYSNRAPGLETGGKKVSAESGGVGGLSNSVWDDPWKKVVDCKGVMGGLLEREEKEGGAWEEDRWVEELEEMMSVSLPPSPSIPYPLSQAPTFPPFSFPLPSNSLPTPFPPPPSPSPPTPSTSPPQQANPSPLPSSPIDPPKPRWYGTRLLTLLLVTHTGDYTFIERDVWVLDPEDETRRPVRGDRGKERRFTGQLEMGAEEEKGA